jgi:predicted small integral membrane protein
MSVLGPLVSGLVAALVVYLLARSTRTDAPPQHGRYHVAYGRGYRLFAAVAFLMSAFVTYAALQSSPDQRTLALIIAVLFWLGTLYLAYEFFFVHLSYDEHFIYHASPLRGRRQIAWEAVTGIHYSAGTQSFTVTTNGYGNLSVSPMADGSRAFVERVSAWVNEMKMTE